MVNTKRTKAVPKEDRRGYGQVKILQPEDLAKYSGLSEKKNALVENRCEVFMHNVRYLCQLHGISQAELCNQKLEGLISSPQLTGYKNRGRDIPLWVMALVASAFDLTVEELCGQLLDEHAALAETSDRPAGRSLAEYEKYVGTYDLAYFDSSRPLGQNTSPTERALNKAVMTIYATYNAIGTASFHVAAIFNCTEEERAAAANAMEGLNLARDGSMVGKRYENAVMLPGPSAKPEARLKCLYEGDIDLTERMVELTLHQVHGSDVAHLFLHNRAATSSEGKAYRGGLATMMSISRGAEHMPCIQAAMMLRSTYTEMSEYAKGKRLPKSQFDFYAPEMVAPKIYLAPPKIELHEEIGDIVNYMKSLFMQNGDTGTLASLSEEDKEFCLEAFAEKKLTETVRRNILGYYKVSIQMDTDIYQMMRDN